ncbi:MAG TPA: hypothetical protein VGP05_06155 [Pseudonocardia sp.]|nr:hypothetical protein [Pseudonocardia sp.]
MTTVKHAERGLSAPAGRQVLNRMPGRTPPATPTRSPRELGGMSPGPPIPLGTRPPLVARPPFARPP